jgi:hypothetical protein
MENPAAPVMFLSSFGKLKDDQIFPELIPVPILKLFKK